MKGLNQIHLILADLIIIPPPLPPCARRGGEGMELGPIPESGLHFFHHLEPHQVAQVFDLALVIAVENRAVQ